MVFIFILNIIKKIQQCGLAGNGNKEKELGMSKVNG